MGSPTTKRKKKKKKKSTAEIFGAWKGKVEKLPCQRFLKRSNGDPLRGTD